MEPYTKELHDEGGEEQNDKVYSCTRCCITHAVAMRQPRRDAATHIPRLTVSLRHALELILLLDGVRVGGTLRGVDQFVRQALRDGLHVTKRGFARAGGDEPDRLVHATQRRHVDRLAANDTRRPDARGVFTGARVDDGIHDDLQRVLVGKQRDDIHGVLHDAHRHELLTVVAAVHHKRVHEALHNGALRFPEALRRVAARSVRDVHGVLRLDADVILMR